MPGAVDLNPDIIRGTNRIAYQDSAGNWRAGPDNKKGKQPGQFIEADYAKRARSNRRHVNSVKGVMENTDSDEDEARERLKDVIEADNDPELDKDEVDAVRRARTGSP